MLYVAFLNRLYCVSGKYKMDGLTEAQERCLNIINNYIEENGCAPTRQELAEFLDEKSTNGVNQKLKQLETKMFIKIYPIGKKRNIVVLRGSERQLVLFKE